jgi:hypothetical protein
MDTYPLLVWIRLLYWYGYVSCIGMDTYPLLVWIRLLYWYGYVSFIVMDTSPLLVWIRLLYWYVVRSDPHSPLRQLRPRVTGARLWLDSGLAEEEEEEREAEEEAHTSFLAHGAGERGRTSDSIEAIEAQQAALSAHFRAIEAGKTVGLLMCTLRHPATTHELRVPTVVT